MTRVAAFVALLGAVFAAALGVGRLVDADAAEPPAAVHGDGGAHDDAFELALDDSRFVAGRPQTLAFTVGDGGRTLDDFDVVHERRMHVIVVGSDGSRFQHLHPTARGSQWVLPVTFPSPGAYRVFADFSTEGDATVVSRDVSVTAGAYERVRDRSGGFDVRLETDPADLRVGEETPLHFSVTRDGGRVDVGRYLGARGHLVVLREEDLEYVHTHAEQDELVFETTFPSAARYRLYLQFRAGGKVRTAAFRVEVAR